MPHRRAHPVARRRSLFSRWSTSAPPPGCERAHFTLDQLELFTTADERASQLATAICLYVRTSAKTLPDKFTAELHRPLRIPAHRNPRTRRRRHLHPSATLHPRSRRIEQPRPGPTWGAPGLNYAVTAEGSQRSCHSEHSSESPYFAVTVACSQTNNEQPATNNCLLGSPRSLLPDQPLPPARTPRPRHRQSLRQTRLGPLRRSRPLHPRARPNFDRITAVEIAEPSFTALASTKLPNRRAVKATTLDFLRTAVLQRDRPDLIVLDPPRTGAGPEVCELLGRIAAPTLIYVSCSPETLARRPRHPRRRRLRHRRAPPARPLPPNHAHRNRRHPHPVKGAPVKSSPTHPKMLYRRLARSVETYGLRGAIAHSFHRLTGSLRNHGLAGSFARASPQGPVRAPGSRAASPLRPAARHRHRRLHRLGKPPIRRTPQCLQHRVLRHHAVHARPVPLAPAIPTGQLHLHRPRLRKRSSRHGRRRVPITSSHRRGTHARSLPHRPGEHRHKSRMVQPHLHRQSGRGRLRLPQHSARHLPVPSILRCRSCAACSPASSVSFAAIRARPISSTPTIRASPTCCRTSRFCANSPRPRTRSPKKTSPSTHRNHRGALHSLLRKSQPASNGSRMKFRPSPPLLMLRRLVRSVEQNGVGGAIAHSYQRLVRSVRTHGLSGTWERAFRKAPAAPQNS